MCDFTFTSLSGTAGHPDKRCDRVSDAIVDAYLNIEPQCRIEAEWVVTSGIVFCACHSNSAAKVGVLEITRRVIAETGYAPLASNGHVGRTDIDVPWERSSCLELLNR